MKLVLGSLLMLAFVACSSAKKTDATTTTTPDATATATETTSTDAATKKSKKSAATPAAETASSDSSGLPTINGTEKSSVTCTNKADTRKISVLNVTEGGCGVVYNKMGEDKTVAMAKSMSYCDTVSSKIKTNLEGAGFNCGGAAATGTSSDQ